MIEPCRLRTLSVHILTIPRHGNQHDLSESGVLTQPPRYPVAVEPRQADGPGKPMSSSTTSGR